MGNHEETLTTQATLQRIWDALGLGTVRTIQRAKRGMNNLATVVNDNAVIRFDLLDLDDVVCRYVGEALAYEKLRAAGIPCPDVITLDVSKALIPYHYIILSKIEGTPLIDDWPKFTEAQKAEAGRTAGRYLAMMHEITFEGFGRLVLDKYPHWNDEVERFFNEYAPGLTAQKVISESDFLRMRNTLDRLQPMLDAVEVGRLVHADYQFENLLHKDGVITGIIDFEWAKSADSAWDFRLDDQWEDDCPGSTAYIYEGYTAVRPLLPDHRTRVWLYKLLFHLDSVDMTAGEAGQEDNFKWFYAEMMKALAALEAV